MYLNHIHLFSIATRRVILLTKVKGIYVSSNTAVCQINTPTDSIIKSNNYRTEWKRMKKLNIQFLLNESNIILKSIVTDKLKF